jgi:hypothetical protein
MLKCGHVTKGGLVIKAWTYELLNKKDVIYDLAAQKQVWLLDLQVDETGEKIHIAGGIGQQRVCNLKVDMAQYSLQYFQLWGKCEIRQRECLEIILPKVHVEERLFSTPCDCIYRWATYWLVINLVLELNLL